MAYVLHPAMQRTDATCADKDNAFSLRHWPSRLPLGSPQLVGVLPTAI